MAHLVVQDFINRLIPTVARHVLGFILMRILERAFEDTEVARVIGEPRPHLCNRKNEIDYASRNRGVRHAGLLRARPVSALRKGQPTALLDRLHAERAVTAAAR